MWYFAQKYIAHPLNNNLSQKSPIFGSLRFHSLEYLHIFALNHAQEFPNQLLFPERLKWIRSILDISNFLNKQMYTLFNIGRFEWINQMISDLKNENFLKN